MHQKIFSTIIHLVLLSNVMSCVPFEYYCVIKDGIAYTDYSWKDSTKKIVCIITATYKWNKWGLTSQVNLIIKNNSSKKLRLSSKLIRLNSVNFQYKNTSSDYEVTIGPNEKDNFIPLDFSARFEDELPIGTRFTMPNDEKITLFLEGIELDEDRVVIDSVEFVPKVNISH